MRAKEFIMEAAWDGMVNRLFRTYPQQHTVIDTYVNWARTALKRQDRIVWFLRQLESQQLQAGQSINTLVNRLQHFMGIEYNPIQTLQFARQEPQELLAELGRMEEQYQARQNKERPVNMQAGDHVLQDFGQGIQWVFVDRAYCADEGRSGRHCGNVDGQHNPDQRILSLRAHGHVECTFILHPDGSLGEMKARGNTKPREQLHPYILWLLQQPFVRSIEGGGYRPSANFDLRDMGPEFIEQLRAARPDFANWSEVARSRERAQMRQGISIDDENIDNIKAIVTAIMPMVRADLDQLVRDSVDDADLVPQALADLDESIDYQAHARVLIDEWHDEGVQQGYYEEGDLDITNIPMGLAYVIGEWNDVNQTIQPELVFDQVKVTYDAQGNTWTVQYGDQSAQGTLRA